MPAPTRTNTFPAGASLPDVEIEALLFQLPESGDGGIMNTDVKAAVLPLTKVHMQGMCMAWYVAAQVAIQGGRIAGWRIGINAARHGRSAACGARAQ